MTVRLTVQRAAWEAHIRSVAATVEGLVPVVKGNGYGFSRSTLHPLAAALAGEVCVGTVHELDGIAAGITPIVLTPARAAPDRTDTVLTVGAKEDVRVLEGWRGDVLVKLRSSMLRFGVDRDAFAGVVDAVGAGGLTIRGAALHLPLAGSDDGRRREIEAWLPHLDPHWPLYVSHLTSKSYGALRHDHPGRSFRLRLGTALWHGDKTFLHLGADVLAVQTVTTDTVAGYHHRPVAAGSAVVMIGAGSANGVAALADGSSPFHHRRRRLVLLEPPHMHTSMVVIPRGEVVPAVGEVVDVQRPLITTTVDELVWTNSPDEVVRRL